MTSVRSASERAPVYVREAPGDNREIRSERIGDAEDLAANPIPVRNLKGSSAPPGSRTGRQPQRRRSARAESAGWIPTPLRMAG